MPSFVKKFLLISLFSPLGGIIISAPTVASCDLFLRGNSNHSLSMKDFRGELALDIVDADAPRHPPLLRLNHDGILRVRGVTPQSPTIVAHLPPKEVSEIFDYVMKTESFGTTETEGLNTLYTPQNQPDGSVDLRLSALRDAPTTYIMVSGAGCHHKISLYGLAAAASLEPKNDMLQRLRRIELFLLDLAENTRKLDGS